MTATGSVANGQPTVKLRLQKVQQIIECVLFCYEYLPLFCGVHHRDKADLHRNALVKILAKILSRQGNHLSIESGVGVRIGSTVPALQRLKIEFCHSSYLALESADAVSKVSQPFQKFQIHGVSLCTWQLDLCPFVPLCQKVLQSMVTAFLVYPQVPVNR